MILQTLILTIIYVVVHLIQIFTYAGDVLISNYLPTVNSGLTTINGFFDAISPTMAYAISYTMLPSSIIGVVVGFWVFSLTVKPMVYLTKNLLHWIKTIKIA